MTLSDAVPLREFLDSVPPLLDGRQRRLVIDQAILLLEQLYAHLPLKRTMFVVDPIGRLKRLRSRVDDLSEVRFHREMLLIFTALRDRHMLYVLPRPFHGRFAWLPFLVERCATPRGVQLLVTHVAQGSAPGAFRPGVRVTHWNGVPADRALEIAGQRYYGSNQAARIAFGIASISVRPLDSALWPEEDWVIVSFEDADGVCGEQRFSWMVSEAPPIWTAAPGDELDPEDYAEGQDRVAERVRRVRKALFAPAAVAVAEQRASLRAIAGGSAAHRPEVSADEELRPGESRLPDNFSFRTARTSAGEFGYIRIWSFENTTDGPGRMPVRNFVDAFAEEFERITTLLPQSGLIIDIRGNPGGRIPAGERAIELLCPTPITPMPMHFRATELVRELCRRAPGALELESWAPSIDLALQTGSVYSRGIPFLPFSRSYNRRGQCYHGPLVLIIDGHCYSTADIFAASFQDHGLGTVLGVDGATGAGGANVWSYEILAKLLGDDERFPTLPEGVTFWVAVRNVTRVGRYAGMVLENLGVVPDVIHQTTRADLLEHNRDLIERAGRILASGHPRILHAEVSSRDSSQVRLSVRARYVDRVDVHADERPFISLDIVDDPVELTVPAAVSVVELTGYWRGELVAQRVLRADDGGLG